MRVSEKIIDCTKWWWIWAFGRLWVSRVLVLIGLSSSAVGLMDFECLWASWILNVLGFEELWVMISKFIWAVLRLWQWIIWRSKPWPEAFVF